MAVFARNTAENPDKLAVDAVGHADKLIKALETSLNLTGPIGFTSQNDDEPPPGTP